MAKLPSCNKLHDVRLPIIDCPCNAGLRAATHTTCHIIRLRDMQIYSGTNVSNIIKDNNEFWHLVNSDRAQISQNFMVNILRKNQWFAKTFVCFSRNCRTQKLILDRTKFVPSAGIAIVFAELLTTVSPPLFLGVPIQ